MHGDMYMCVCACMYVFIYQSWIQTIVSTFHRNECGSEDKGKCLLKILQ